MMVVAMLLAARCEPGGPSVLEGPGIDGSNTEVDAASRLRDYLADSRYPTDSRPARSDTQTDLSRWPGLPAAKSDGVRIEGYAGVKTGTTSAAGACLVSLGRRDGRSLLIVVLGSANSDARYVDSRNLYRWAWTTLAGRRPAVVR